MAFPKQRSMPSWAERRWLALANLIWSTGSKWLEISQLVIPNFAEHHPVYYARARTLELDHRILFDHPEIERIQGIGFLHFTG